MDIAVKQFYERGIDALVKAAQEGQQDYELVKDDFLKHLENHLDHTAHLTNIVKDLKSVSQRLFFIDERIRERANQQYRNIPAQYNKMGDMLKNAFERMDLSIKNEDFRDACKFIVIQAEIISEYLIREFNIINTWVSPDAELVKKYNLQKNNNTNKLYLTTWYKLVVARDFCGHNWDDNSIVIVKNIRDYGSHGYHESDIKKHDNDVAIVSKDYRKYFNEWFSFINAVKIKLYSKLPNPIIIK